MTPWYFNMLAWYNPATAEPNYFNHEDLGMSPAVYALVFAIISGISLPIGACIGIALSPVSDKVCSMMMAFGAGALLFAVTVELYAHALMEVVSGKSGLIEMSATVIGAFLGCASYLAINRRLEQHLIPDVEFPNEAGACESDSIMDHMCKQISEADSSNAMHRQQSSLQRGRTLDKAIQAMMVALCDPPEVQQAKSVALALFLGLLCDGVPEGILLGFLAAESHLSPVLIISLFIANFPTAFSSSSLLMEARMSTVKILGLWSSLCLLVGCLAWMSCWMLLQSFPAFGQGGFHSKSLPLAVLVGVALTEGITGGAMLACISGVMLPEAFERNRKSDSFYSHSGFLCVAGFIVSLTLKTLLG